MLKLKAEKISKSYNGKLLFRDMSLDISEGESLCVWGPNGSGKSTLLKTLAGLVRPAKGEVLYEDGGTPLKPHRAKALFGIASPDVVMYDELTPRENLEFLSRVRGLNHDGGAILALLDEFGIAAAADSHSGTMSSGMKQRLRLAAAFLHDPRVILLDEPTSYLDTDGADRVEKFVLDRKPGRILVVATNNTREREWCGRVVELGIKEKK